MHVDHPNLTYGRTVIQSMRQYFNKHCLLLLTKSASYTMHQRPRQRPTPPSTSVNDASSGTGIETKFCKCAFNSGGARRDLQQRSLSEAAIVAVSFLMSANKAMGMIDFHSSFCVCAYNPVELDICENNHHILGQSLTQCCVSQ